LAFGNIAEKIQLWEELREKSQKYRKITGFQSEFRPPLEYVIIYFDCHIVYMLILRVRWQGHVNFGFWFCVSKRTSFLCKVIFFPPNFSFVFWKREFRREKISLQKSGFLSEITKWIHHQFGNYKKLILDAKMICSPF
jgi:hypothetical protein